MLLGSSPARGGTGGGTLISITGRNFPTDMQMIVVTVAGIECILEQVMPDLIQCRTEPYYYSSISSPIVVFIENQGLALNEVNKLKLH